MKQITNTILLFFTLSIITGIVYPLALTGIAQLAFPQKANGSPVTVGGRTIGSSLLGEKFTEPRYFHGRPSAVNYDSGNSGGSNFGPTNKKLFERSERLAVEIRAANGLPSDAKIPADLLLASGSGLDPHISLEAALLQAPRIATARGIDKISIIKLVRKTGEKLYFGIFGDPIVNVLDLNCALDRIEGAR